MADDDHGDGGREQQERCFQNSTLSPSCITLAACAPVMLAAPSVSTCLLGRLKLARLVKLNVSQRNWAFARSASVKRLLKARLNAMKPGPSRISRPELPK